jgi:methyl-accepting chemotaxis protein-1 (serine sensor receptor)
MTDNASDTTVAEARRRVLSLSASVGAVLIVIVTIATYGMHRLGAVVAENTASIEALGEMADAARVAQVTFKTQVQEWKNTLLRGHDAGDFRTYHGAFVARRAEVQTELAGLAQRAGRLGFPTGDIEALKTMHGALDATYDEALAGLRADEPLSARMVDGKVRGRDRPVNEAFDALVASVKNFTDGKRAALRADIESVASRMSALLWFSLAIGLAVLGLASFMSVRAVRRY